MSGSEQVRPQSRELEILRALFDRNLKDRATALAESRWPGSGQMIDLAYEWSGLTPTERRARLSEIGPERIARLRRLAALNPDLDAAVTELDRRGVLPHLEAAAQAGVESAAGEEAPASVTATTEGIEGGPVAQVEDVPRPEAVEPAVEAAPASDASDVEEERIRVEPAFTPDGIDGEELNDYELNVDMPQLDLGLPSTTEFLDSETERRAKAVQDAESALERVRQRLDRSTDRALGRARQTVQRAFPDMAPVELPELAPAQEALPEPEDAADRAPRIVEAPDWLVDAFTEDVVVTVVEPRQPPGDDEIVALANELGIGLKEFQIEPGGLRKVYGGLVNRGGMIDVEAGPLPSALAERNLAVVRGRIHPNFVKRLNQGFADIPGTRATVQLHEKARVLIIPNR